MKAGHGSTDIAKCSHEMVHELNDGYADIIGLSPQLTINTTTMENAITPTIM